MKKVITFLKVNTALLFMGLCVVIVSFFIGPPDSAKEFTQTIGVALYMAFGVLLGIALIYKFNAFNKRTLILLSALYGLVFFLPAVVLLFIIFMLSGVQC